jgi:signal transduction histidine kinase
MSAIWRPTDFASMASQIVEQADKLFVDTSVVLCISDPGSARELRVVAATGDWTSLIGRTVEETAVAARAAAGGHAVSASLPSAEVVIGGEFQPASPHVARAVPLSPGARLPDGRTSLGVLVLVRGGADSFTDAEQRMMEEFAKLVSLAAHRAELLADARKSAHRLQLTLDLAMAFASSNSPRTVIQLLLSRTLDAVQADRATLSRLEGDQLVIEATYARSGELTWVGRRYSLDWLEGQPLVKQAIDTAMPVVGGRLDAGAAAPEFRDALSEVRQTATLPLMLGGQVAGTLVVSRVEDRTFDDADVSVLELMGNAAMLALRNARLVEDLQVANTAKSEFLNLAAHELRTPVTVISGYTSMLQSGALDGADASAKALKVIEDKAGELARLVDSLLVTARLQTPSTDVELREFDCTIAIRAAVDRAAPFAKLAGGSVSAEVPDTPLVALGEPELVARILDNLLNNAIAYSDGAPRVSVNVVANERHVDIDVSDGGRGIPASHHAAVFDEFVRVDDGPARGGAGLGLYIARRLARTMGGELTLVRSAPGDGSVFRLRLVRA